jgi:hypothetical protein
MRCHDSLERSEQHGVMYDGVCCRVILVNAIPPMGDNVGWLHLTNDICDESPHFFCIRQLPIAVRGEDRLNSKNLCCRQRLAAFLITICLRGHVGIATFSEGKVKNRDSISELVVFRKYGSAGDLYIAAVCADGEDSLL